MVSLCLPLILDFGTDGFCVLWMMLDFGTAVFCVLWITFPPPGGVEIFERGFMLPFLAVEPSASLYVAR